MSLLSLFCGGFVLFKSSLESPIERIGSPGGGRCPIVPKSVWDRLHKAGSPEVPLTGKPESHVR